jgi:hypothetical protein
MEGSELPLGIQYLGVPGGVPKAMPIADSSQIMHLCCTYIKTNSKRQNELPLDPRHLGVQSDASKMIYGSVVCLAQTVNLVLRLTLSPNGPKRVST